MLRWKGSETLKNCVEDLCDLFRRVCDLFTVQPTEEAYFVGIKLECSEVMEPLWMLKVIPV